ncbi:class II aldolase and adducin N-terminal domain-containing protein [Helicobacter cetorum]|uniref:class II aldolase and adducin N-terminal domain-containing protein n=1 Tax=Helicobacter cetorum TaxID=138563 RepID=UPI000CF0B820|nr:class II aldolase and adducin N-terminal domain-containing protein [Helicobacter cetorum]
MPSMNMHTRGIDTDLIVALKDISLSMFRKGFFGLYQGSISARIGTNQFIINKRDAVFDHLNENTLLVLHDKVDYRWREASIDSSIHASVYQEFLDAKFIAYARPPYSLAYSLRHEKLLPRDYLGHRFLGEEVPIYDPRDYDNWYERANIEILRQLQESGKFFVFIKGCGIFAYHRELHGLMEIFDLIENSCKVLRLGDLMDCCYNGDERFNI